MRLESFIKTSTMEEVKSAYDIIKKRVSKEFITLVKKNNTWFTRERIYSLGADVKEFETRKDRKPVDTDQGIHDYFNKELEKRFGWKPRSEGVFAWNTQIREGEYFFPIGDFKYIYSPTVKDLFLTTSKLVKMFGEGVGYYLNIEDVISDTRIKEEFDMLVKTYKDTGIENVNNRIEVIFKCKSYLLVNYALDLEIEDLFNW